MPAAGCCGRSGTDNWRAGAKPAQAAFAASRTAIAASEPVTVGVSAAQYQNARARLPRGVRVVEIEQQRCLDARQRTHLRHRRRRAGGAASTGPSTPGAGSTAGCTSPGTATTRWRKRCWRLEGADRYRTPFVLEGGAIHVDGQGTCLTTEECLLNPNRNPGSRAPRSRRMLRRYLGVSTVIWLGAGVHLDETGGHIDELACFTSPGHVALTWTEDRADPQYEISQDAYQRLRKRPRRARPAAHDPQDSPAGTART